MSGVGQSRRYLARLRLSTTPWAVVVLYAAVVVCALIVSLPMATLLVTILFGGVAVVVVGQRINHLTVFAPTIPIAVLMLASVVAVQIGVSVGIAVVATLLAAFGVVLLSRAWRGGIDWSVYASPSVPMIALVPLSTMAVASLVWPGMESSWAAIGDALHELNIARELSVLGAGQAIPDAFPVGTHGHDFLVGALFTFSSFFGQSDLRTHIDALAATAMVPLILGVLQLFVGLGDPQRRWFGAAQGLTLGALICTSAIVGLPASNGYVNPGMTFALYAMTIVAVDRFYRTRSKWSSTIALIGVVALLGVWTPIGFVAFVLWFATLVVGSRERTFLVVSAIGSMGVIVVYWLMSSILELLPPMPISYGSASYLPITPIAVFAIATFGIIVLSRDSASRPAFRMVPLAALGGSIAMIISMGHGHLLGVLADSHILSATMYYYVLKFIWLACMPLIVMLLILVLDPQFPRSFGKATFAGMASLVLFVGFMFANTPNMPWIPVDGRPHVQRLAEFIVDPVDAVDNPDEVDSDAVRKWAELCHSEVWADVCGPTAAPRHEGG